MTFVLLEAAIMLLWKIFFKNVHEILAEGRPESVFTFLKPCAGPGK
jgi:hypothetical protein